VLQISNIRGDLTANDGSDAFGGVHRVVDPQRCIPGGGETGSVHGIRTLTGVPANSQSLRPRIEDPWAAVNVISTAAASARTTALATLLAGAAALAIAVYALYSVFPFNPVELTGERVESLRMRPRGSVASCRSGRNELSSCPISHHGHTSAFSRSSPMVSGSDGFRLSHADDLLRRRN
jgi:hypothetical protein